LYSTRTNHEFRGATVLFSAVFLVNYSVRLLVAGNKSRVATTAQRIGIYQHSQDPRFTLSRVLADNSSLIF